jgi:hypothetical protein
MKHLGFVTSISVCLSFVAHLSIQILVVTSKLNPLVALQVGLKPGGIFVLKENIAKNGKNQSSLHCICHSMENSLHSFFPIPVRSTSRPEMMCLCTGFVVDKEDSSVTRSDAYFRDLFKQTGFHLYKTRVSSSTFHVTNLCSTENSAICISTINFNFWHAHWMGSLSLFLTKWIGVFFGSYRRGSPKICLQCACMR